MYYNDDTIAEVLLRNDILDTIGSYVKLTKKGSNYWGKCPFHDGNDELFLVNKDKQVFHCFDCGAGGNVISFVMKYEDVTFREAVEILADRANIELPEYNSAKQDRREKLFEINEAAALYFHKCLVSARGKKGMEYLTDRGLSEETISRFGLGYAPLNGKEIAKYLKAKGFTDEEIASSGLVVTSEKHGASGYFWDRVMFPITNTDGRIVGFGGRVMSDVEPKYLNSPKTDVFNKRENLYGLSIAKDSSAESLILCEGYMDAISMHQAGFDQAVASLGTAFPDEQMELLSKYTKKVLLAYDSDGPGTKAILNAIEKLRKAGISSRVINLNPCKDPDEFIKTYGKEEFQKRINSAENSFYFKIRTKLEKCSEKEVLYRDATKILCEEFNEPLEREQYLLKICEKYKLIPLLMKDCMPFDAVSIGDLAKFAKKCRTKASSHKIIASKTKSTVIFGKQGTFSDEKSREEE